jgi:protein TonB
MFEQMLLPNGHAHQGRCFVFAFAGELGALTLFTLIMAFSDAIPLSLPQLAVPLVLSALPPPPPAAVTRAPARTAASKVMLKTFVAPVLTAPRTIPKQTMVIVDAEPSLQDVSGVVGGVPGGIPGGSLNELVGALFLPPPVAARNPPRPAATPPVPTAPRQIRVGGEVEAALLAHEVAPVYPPFAKRARIEGTIELSATIALDGKVKDLAVVSGNPLLIEAAQNAVKQWVYRPTYLNGQPVEVLTIIDVRFRLVHALD